MKTKFSDFIKLNESNSLISLIDLEGVIQKIFDESKVHSVKTVYENNDEGLKLVTSINNLFFDHCNILHTKFIFNVDNEKSKLINNNFKYLYDINCNYVEVNFDDIVQLEERITEIIDDKKFGDDIIDISNIFVTMSTDINKELEDIGMNNISVYNVGYSPLVDIVPCEAFSFDFKVNINNIDDLKLNIKKISNNEYTYTFNHHDWNEEITKSDIKGTVDTIVEIFKKHIK